jgi:hypothetical protein
MATMAFMEGEMNTASFVSTGNATWCLLLLEHLEEFAKLAWYLVADGGLVEETFTRTMVQLDVTPLDTSIPELAYNQAREILISQAIAVLANTRREEEELTARGDGRVARSSAIGVHAAAGGAVVGGRSGEVSRCKSGQGAGAGAARDRPPERECALSGVQQFPRGVAGARGECP